MRNRWKNELRRVLALCCALALLLPALTACGGKKKEEAPIPAATNEERLTYLGEMGWQVDPEPLETLALQLPRELSGEYDDYVRTHSASLVSNVLMIRKAQ